MENHLDNMMKSLAKIKELCEENLKIAAKQKGKLRNWCWECESFDSKFDEDFCHECCMDENCKRDHSDYDINPEDYKGL